MSVESGAMTVRASAVLTPRYFNAVDASLCIGLHISKTSEAWGFKIQGYSSAFKPVKKMTKV